MDLGEKEGTKKRRVKLHEVSLEQDIRYRGPLSYRHFKILGWIFLACGQLSVILHAVSEFQPDSADLSLRLLLILSNLAALSFPFFLFANFAIILDNRDGYKRQMMINGTAAGIIVVIFELFLYRYILGIVTGITHGEGNPNDFINSVVYSGTLANNLMFNMFIDLLLCNLFMLFLNYRPGRVFVGKKLNIFRAFCVFPILYELTVLLLKALISYGKLQLPLFLFPFMTTKPPMTFLVFIIMALYLKRRERRFCRFGRTHEEYMAFTGTNRNSLQFSVFAAILLVVAGVLDFVILTIFSVGNMAVAGTMAADDTAMVSEAVQMGLNLGFGKAIQLIPMAPIVLLFSYTRTHKNTFIDMLLPLGGILLIVLVYIESGYQAITMFLGSV